MTGFLEIVVVAAVAQLAVLPGEKVQFIIAGLSTRYRPLLVVTAAGLAFAGWTVVEIAFGAALQGTLPRVYLDLITAGLFFVFAVLLVRSAPGRGDRTLGPSTDGGQAVQLDTSGSTPAIESITIAGREVSMPERFGSFLPIFVLMAVGEFGDKTQAVTIGLAVQFGATPAIWVGEMLAIVPVSLANAYFFHRLSRSVDLRKAHLAGAAIFAFFGLDTVLAVVTGFSVWETVVTAVADAVLALI